MFEVVGTWSVVVDRGRRRRLPRDWSWSSEAAVPGAGADHTGSGHAFDRSTLRPPADRHRTFQTPHRVEPLPVWAPRDRRGS